MIKFKGQLLILLVTAHNAKLGAAVCPLFLLQDECAIRRTEQAVCPRNHVEAVLGFHLARMMNHQQAHVVLVAERLEFGHDLIIAGVVVLVSAEFPNLLQRIHDDELGVRVFLHEQVKLIAQSAAKRPGLRGEVQRICALHAKHLEQTLLNPRVVVLQGEVQDLARMDGV